MKKYFSFNEHDGFELHATKEEAISHAQAALDAEREQAIKDGEWYDEAQTICCGVVTHITKADSLPPDGTEYNIVVA